MEIRAVCPGFVHVGGFVSDSIKLDLQNSLFHRTLAGKSVQRSFIPFSYTQLIRVHVTKTGLCVNLRKLQPSNPVLTRIQFARRRAFWS